jgi:transposase-like protein
MTREYEDAKQTLMLQKPSSGKAHFNEEYKDQALELWKSSGRSAAKVAAELGIRPPLLYRWARERPL